MSEIEFISEERLRTFLAHAQRPKNAIALHNHTLQLGSSLLSVIALIELSLRNSTNHRLIQDFKVDNWLLPTSAIVNWKEFEKRAVKTAMKHARKAAYAKLTHGQKQALNIDAFPNGVPQGAKYLDVVSKRQSTLPVSHGQIVSQTTLSFWKRLYSGDYEAELWKTSLKKVFPNKDLKRGDISTNLEVVYATRNRVAHHEPVYGRRLEDAMQAIDFVRKSLGAKKNETETAFMRFSQVQTLRLQMDYEAFLRAWDILAD